MSSNSGEKGFARPYSHPGGFAMKLTLPSVSLVVVFCSIASWAEIPGWAQAYSHARIVRLSFVEGTVTVQRPDLADWATAPVNTPIQEGFKLSTAESSFAEVEFENTSTVRLGQLSLIEFTQLALSPSGGKINRIQIHQGYATSHVIPESDDIYEFKTADTTLTPYDETIFRVDHDEGSLRVEVFKGSVEVSSVYGTRTLAKNTVLELRPGSEQPELVSQGITTDAWDEWVERRESQGSRLERARVPGPYSADVGSILYGWDDLRSYGTWSDMAGYGYVWSPSVYSGWIPYSNGRWCWYPGLGFTWISFEPWGWLPYHYGQWVYANGAGWCWRPGNFGVWSPAMVSWYQGPGWIGWAPRASVVTGVLPANCLQAPGCATVVSVDTFQNGRPVAPGNILGIDAFQGRPVDHPEIPLSRLAMLPGSPYPRGAAIPGVQGMPQVGGVSGVPGVSVRAVGSDTGNKPVAAPTVSSKPAGSSAPTRPVAADPGSTIVYDPIARRYVNGHGPAPVQNLGEAPQNGPTGIGSLQAAPAASPQWPVVSNAPAAPAAPQPSAPAASPVSPMPSNRPVPREGWRLAGDNPAPSGFPSRPAATGVPFGGPATMGPTSAPRSTSAPPSRPSYSLPPSSPSIHSSPSSGPRFGGGSSVSSGPSTGSGSFGGARGSGGGSSGASGGGAVGGGRGGGHTSGGPHR